MNPWCFGIRVREAEDESNREAGTGFPSYSQNKGNTTWSKPGVGRGGEKRRVAYRACKIHFKSNIGGRKNMFEGWSWGGGGAKGKKTPLGPVVDAGLVLW